MQQEAPAPQKKPDEVAQIVMVHTGGVGVIARFKDEKRAKKSFDRLHELWVNTCSEHHIVRVGADMFDIVVDLSTLLHMSLVIHKVASKFEPWRG